MTPRTLDAVVLATGAHGSAEDGLCAMEAVAWLANEPHSDHPECACPVLSSYIRTLNDGMPDDQRQKLKAFIPQLVGSRNADLELERGRVLAWASITMFAPTALHAVGLIDHADIMRGLPKYDGAAARSAESAARSAARSAAESAESAARSAAWSAESAARSAAWSAAWSAESAGESVWDHALAALQQALEVKA